MWEGDVPVEAKGVGSPGARDKGHLWAMTAGN